MRVVLLALALALVLAGSGCVRDGGTGRVVSSPGQQDQAGPAGSGFTSALVDRVIDGDTIELEGGQRVRLAGINAPERGERCYEDAKGILDGLIENENVTLEAAEQDADKDGRLLRYVFFGSELVNLRMVREGLASVYEPEGPGRYSGLLREAEGKAREEVLCIWDLSLGCRECIEVTDFVWNAMGNDCENLNGEHVTLRNSCESPCDMTGWTVRDSGNHRYDMGEFVLAGESNVTLYTGDGQDSGTELYWNNSGYLCNSIWNNGGDTLFLRDEEDRLALEYEY